MLRVRRKHSGQHRIHRSLYYPCSMSIMDAITPQVPAYGFIYLASLLDRESLAIRGSRPAPKDNSRILYPSAMSVQGTDVAQLGWLYSVQGPDPCMELGICRWRYPIGARRPRIHIMRSIEAEHHRFIYTFILWWHMWRRMAFPHCLIRGI